MSRFDFSMILQELNKKKGIKEELQLSSKQKEMIQAQQDREASIRKRLQLVRPNATRNHL